MDLKGRFATFLTKKKKKGPLAENNGLQTGAFDEPVVQVIVLYEVKWLSEGNWF